MTHRLEYTPDFGSASTDAGRLPAGEGSRRPGGIVFPRAMEARFWPALTAIYDEMYARDDVVALLCFGSAQRGEARPGSDLDLRAATLGSERWMESRMVKGIEVQLKVGPLRSWRGMVAKQHPAITESFATGELLFDKSGEATDLKRFAEERYRAGPRRLDAAGVEGVRYGLTNFIRDLEDMSGETVAARMLASVLVMETLRSWCMFRSIWETRKPTMMLRNIRVRDPWLVEHAERFYASPSPALAIAVADAALEAMGGRLYHISMLPEPA